MTDRPTLGIFGPAPDHRTGVARYIRQSIPHLSHYFTCSWNEGQPHDFDHVLYHLGNNVMHHEAFQALRRRSGPVIMHEYNNLDYYFSAWDLLPCAEQRELLSLLTGKLRRHFSDRTALEDHFAAHPEIDRFSIDVGCERLAIAQAARIFVHSAGTGRALAQRYPGTRIDVLPFPVEPIGDGSATAARRRLDIPADAYVFATFGFIGEYKRVERILYAWQGWEGRPARVVLVLAGQRQYDIEVPACRSIIQTGYLTDEDFDGLIAAADCGIQLRHPSLGETSGPAAALVAHRRPVILSDIPEMRSLALHQGVTLVPVGEGETAAITEAMRAHYGRPSPPSSYDRSFSWECWAAVVTARLLDIGGRRLR